MSKNIKYFLLLALFLVIVLFITKTYQNSAFKETQKTLQFDGYTNITNDGINIYSLCKNQWYIRHYHTKFIATNKNGK